MDSSIVIMLTQLPPKLTQMFKLLSLNMSELCLVKLQ